LVDIETFAPILAAPFIGSFMGVLIVRLPHGEAVVFARSFCRSCGTTLSAIDMIPLISFFAAGGRCRHCRQTIGWFHPAIELAALGIAGWAALADPDRLWTDCGLGWTLLTLSWIDVSSFLLPDVLTLPLLLSGLTVTGLTDPDALTDHCIAAGFGYLAFQGLAVAYRHLRGREGLGGGDAKLIAAAGAWCGLALLPFVILGSAIAGLLTALGLALTGHAVTSGTRIPYGPCIAAALWLVWLYGWTLNPILGGQ
jgi:leader peptidase (prepilin peptidase)/N-methyltransferase